MSLLKVGGAPNDISSLRKGRKLAVGSMSDLIIVKKIGEGGSAYIYTARRSGSGGIGIGSSSSGSGGSAPKNGISSPRRASSASLSSPSVVRSLNLFSDSACSVSGLGLGGGAAAADSESVLNDDNDDDAGSVMSYAVGDTSSGGNARGGGGRRRRRSLLSRMGSSRGGIGSRRPSLPLPLHHSTSSAASAAASGNNSPTGTTGNNNSDRQNHHHHQQQQQLVVIKATSTSGSARRRRQAEKEIELLLRFRGHPNIVHIYDWASTTSSSKSSPTKAGGSGRSLVTLCAMEYCHGGSLMDLICKRREVLHAERQSRRGLESEGGGANIGLFTEKRDGNNSNNGARGSGFRRRLKNFTTGTRGDEDDDDIIPPPPPALPFASEGCSTNVSRAYLDFDDILSIFQQVATAIDFLHGQHDVGSSVITVANRSETRPPS